MIFLFKFTFKFNSAQLFFFTRVLNWFIWIYNWVFNATPLRFETSVSFSCFGVYT